MIVLGREFHIVPRPFSDEVVTRLMEITNMDEQNRKVASANFGSRLNDRRLKAKRKLKVKKY